MYGYGNHANFMRAQRAYDNAEPADWDAQGIQSVECNAELDYPEDAPEDIDLEPPVCGWSGREDVYWAGDTGHWTCPACGAENEEDAPEPYED